MMRKPSRWLLKAAAALSVVVVLYGVWLFVQPKGLPAGLASGNGRIEAVEIDIATKTAGRVEDILVDEGDFVTAGQVLARMDTDVLQAQAKQAEAQKQQAVIGVETARHQVLQRQAERQAALSLVAQREAERDVAQKQLARSEELEARGTTSRQVLDSDRARFESANAAVSAAKAQVAAADAAIATAEAQVVNARAAVDAAAATVERIQADIRDSTLRSPRDGRVQFRVAQPGEVLGAGGRVLNMVDLSDVYMTFFLPTEAAGRVRIGTEVRIALDAFPQYVIPAKATFVADVAQFTPKTVETANERQKLMFRIKAQIPPPLLKKYIRDVKTGLPGVAYVRIDPDTEWPANLQNLVP
ncbi:HlyD family efflux transporter periplasmic adaptor subunit (plasmid) [Azospirillum brasilense]|uniref:HlyD family efflux transporter periplasmic adaptor subunit n=1 Tax=Azospirillum brasilense TaxID=192 RepID=A0A4D8QQB9_AZOBR|nr:MULTISPECIES: HlyD family efflux transporter periplasmic adaptor subunit [Azospirillum]MDW7554433.1 HlyD family efflux transporter periplasmic adaptor subunit [Azospirillum brasilense]MDW7556306.1 HlyD family efflux transporter periplasmic adaptor subunit [Azospirillum brasilense]MDW7594048.1 HlyD family efflux transporter periplasmic adaptor subunit [Azospirillum brasilense]MDW7631680.1 HlyD family efflux transporter periplasmic adaptor subunit [Azospirillum brasilense]MDX5949982.1 HlyD fa